MGREDPQLKLRLSEEMKEEITTAARSNGRSVNAEIVHRLDRTLTWDEDGEREADELIADLRSKLDEAVGVNAYLEDLKKELLARLDKAETNGAAASEKMNEEPIFNIVLDAKGHPLDWPTIAAHIHRTAKAAGIDTAGFRAAIFDTKKLDDPHDNEFRKLVRWYQDQTRKHKAFIRGEDSEQ